MEAIIEAGLDEFRLHEAAVKSRTVAEEWLDQQKIPAARDSRQRKFGRRRPTYFSVAAVPLLRA